MHSAVRTGKLMQVSTFFFFIVLGCRSLGSGELVSAGCAIFCRFLQFFVVLQCFGVWRINQSRVRNFAADFCSFSSFCSVLLLGACAVERVNTRGSPTNSLQAPFR